MNRFRAEDLHTLCGGPYSFSAASGECLALSGPSGCGKTLLLRALADLDPAEGIVSLDGENREGMPAPQWRRKVGWLAAESAWWAETVGAHFRGQESGGRGQKLPTLVNNSRLLASIGGSAFQTLGKLGFEADVMEWRVDRLSTGEKQRLALCRLLLNEPQVLLLDEPTAALDRANVHRAEEVIAAYRRTGGAVVLWVSHDPEQIARTADRHLRFRNGGLEAAE